MITVLNIHSSTALSLSFFFFSLCLPFGVKSSNFGWAGQSEGGDFVGGSRGYKIQKCHNAKTSSIYCFRDCLLYLVRVSF